MLAAVARSLLRMATAYALSLAFAIPYGVAAATHKRAGAVMVALLDILQSVPILGFFPLALFLFVALAGDPLGAEVASVFLIFTSQVWNIAFGVYERYSSIPEDLVEVARLYKMSGWSFFRKVGLPFTMPSLVYNSVISWANGWFFIMSAEVITLGTAKCRLEGIGSYLFEAAFKSAWWDLGVGILTLGAVILTMDVLVWHPLADWAEKFKYEYVGPPTPVRTTFLDKAGRVVGDLLRALSERLPELPPSVAAALGRARALAARKTLRAAAAAAAASALVYCAVASGLLARLEQSAARLAAALAAVNYAEEGALIASGLALSTARLLAAYVISLAWTLPVAYLLSVNKGARRILMPLFEVLASLPAVAFFPLVVVLVVNLIGSIELAAVLMILSGMQWYVLFNAMAGFSSVPAELRELSGVLRVRGWLLWKRVLLPCIFPALVTGSITGWGGGWNALIVAEYIRAAGVAVTTGGGIGYLINEAADGGRVELLTIRVAAMTAFVLLLNRFVWQKLYRLATTKFKIEGAA